MSLFAAPPRALLRRVAYSLDMTDWSNTLDSGIPVDTGDTTTRAFNLASAGIDTEPACFSGWKWSERWG